MGIDLCLFPHSLNLFSTFWTNVRLSLRLASVLSNCVVWMALRRCIANWITTSLKVHFYWIASEHLNRPCIICIKYVDNFFDLIKMIYAQIPRFHWVLNASFNRYWSNVQLSRNMWFTCISYWNAWKIKILINHRNVDVFNQNLSRWTVVEYAFAYESGPNVCIFL